VYTLNSIHHPVILFSAVHSHMAIFRLYFDLQHSSTHPVDFQSDEPARQSSPRAFKWPACKGKRSTAGRPSTRSKQNPAVEKTIKNPENKITDTITHTTTHTLTHAMHVHAGRFCGPPRGNLRKGQACSVRAATAPPVLRAWQPGAGGASCLRNDDGWVWAVGGVVWVGRFTGLSCGEGVLALGVEV
jgi:hypothetical protein